MNEILFEKAKELVFEEAMQTTTLGAYDISTALTYSLIPTLIWYEIKLGAKRREAFILACEQKSFVGVAGNLVHVPILERDEFETSTLTEETMDADGMTKTKMTPDSIQIAMTDIIYCATKISDVLLEDSPSLGWVRASLQKMGEALQYTREVGIEAILYAGAGFIEGAAAAGVLAYDDIIDLKAQMGAVSWYDDLEPALLFVNPEGKADLLKERGADAPFATERYQGSRIPFVGYPEYAGCIVLTTTVQRDNFATLVQSPQHPFGASVLAAWKRPPKVEKWREAQYQRDLFSISERRGFGVAYPNAIGLISNC